MPSLLAALFLWTAWLLVFLFFPPEAFLAPFLFLILTFFAVFLTSALLFANTRRGFLIGIGVLFLAILNYYKVGNYLNIILITGILLSVEYYFASQNTPPAPRRG